METNIVKTTASTLKNIELFLLNLRYKEGRLVEVEGNKPLLLNDPDIAWIVYSGTVDVFSVPIRENEIVGTRNHLFRSGMGQLLLGMNGSGNGSDMALLVSGTPGTRVLQLSHARLFELAADLEYETLVVSMINDWITGLSGGIFNKILPKDYTLLEASQEFVLEADEPTIVTPKKGVVWLDVCEGEVLVEGEQDLTLSNSEQLIPLAQFVWLRPSGATRLSVSDTKTVLSQQTTWKALDNFHHLVIDAIALKQSRETAAEWERLRQKEESERLVMENALLRLGSTLSEDVTFIKSLAVGHDALWSACALICAASDIEIVPPTTAAIQQLEGYELLEKIAQTSRFRTREVALRRAWWRKDNGPLLAFTKNDQPVALIPISANQYELVDPINKTKIAVHAEVAEQLSPLAYAFYRPFPQEVLTAWKIVKFGLQNCSHDLRRILVIGIVLGLLRLLPPVATGFIFNTYIPEANMSGLVQMGIALLIVAVAVGMFQITQGTALLRLQSRMDASIQAALWDRLLSLPLPFFRRYNSGELGSRVMGIATIRRILSGYVINTMLTFVFTSFNVILLFFYSTTLAWLAIGLLLIALLITIWVSVSYIKLQRHLTEARNTLSGLVLQLLTGIVKIRITASEGQAFALWTEEFVEQRKLHYRARKVMNGLSTFNGVFPLFTSVAIFAAVAYSSSLSDLSTGDYLAFSLALIQFLAVWMQMSNSLAAIAATVPIYEHLKPVLEAEPEVDDVKLTPQTLTGTIEVSHVSFRYDEKSPLVLKDISLNITPGELVAFVGHSGSGKSTLLRLLLGFDSLETGGVYYDGQDLADLDIREVRRQMGVVLQNSALMTGDIYENIVGASNLTIDDAWEAARMVGLAPDLENMPMGMNTIVTGQGHTLSGGQRQRILIARAIVNRPRILFFDEATSALDNQTQQIVSHSLEGLQATRILIAHRLSTIMNADRIYVFDEGEIVQAGTYSQLINQPGPFAELARRQMV